MRALGRHCLNFNIQCAVSWTSGLLTPTDGALCQSVILPLLLATFHTWVQANTPGVCQSIASIKKSKKLHNNKNNAIVTLPFIDKGIQNKVILGDTFTSCLEGLVKKYKNLKKIFLSACERGCMAQPRLAKGLCEVELSYIFKIIISQNVES